MDAKGLASRIKKHGAKKVLVQVPEGLKMKALNTIIVDELEREGISAILSAETCYGACDLRDREAKALGCELLVHIGHSDLGLKTAVPVIYEEYMMDLDIVPLLEKNSASLKKYKKIGLVTTLQYVNALESAKNYLESKQGGNKKVVVGIPEKAKHPGQVLGCDFSAALPAEETVDCFLFIGSGIFHPLGLAMKTDKPVIFIDVETEEVRELKDERDKRLIIRSANLQRAMECRNFGVLVSTKQGQLHVKAAELVKEKLKSKGRSAWIIAMDEIKPEKLLGLDLDCLVNCACPRLTGDVSQFKKPILDTDQIEEL